MLRNLLATFFISLATNSVGQTLDWFDLTVPNNFLNSQFFHAPITSAVDGIWVASLDANQDIAADKEYGSLLFRNFGTNGILIEEVILNGKGHVESFKSINEELLMHIIIKDSLQLDEVWVNATSGFSENFFVRRSPQGTFSYTSLGDEEVSSSCITSEGNMIYTEQVGSGVSVDLKIIDIDGQLIETKPLDHIGRVRNIEEKDNGQGFLLLGSCSEAVVIDGVEINIPDSYNAYIMSFDIDLNLEWYKLIEDVSCTHSFGWSDDETAYWYGGTWITPDFGELDFEGPNSIGFDFFHTRITADEFNWVQEVPGNEGWYGAGPSQQSAMDVDVEGNTYLIGYVQGNDIPWSSSISTENQGMRDVFIASYNPDGDMRWAKTFGSINSDTGLSIHVEGVDVFYITALINGSLILDGMGMDSEQGSLLTAKFQGSFLSARDISDQSKFYVFPNPVKNYLEVGLREDMDIKKIAIRTSNGMLIKEWPESTSQKIDVSDIPPGLYVLSVRTIEVIEHIRFVKD